MSAHPPVVPQSVDMAIFDFEMATMSAAHDMSGAMERKALKEARSDLVAAIADAIEQEREACAVLADNWIAEFSNNDIDFIPAKDYATDAVADIADAIRARSKP